MIFAVILAGGSGTRFWPLSRKRMPKQFLRLSGKETLLQQTAKRMLPLTEWENLIIVACKEHSAMIRSNLPKLPKNNILVEPRARNTAPAIGLAALAILERDPSGMMVALPSDHLIRPASEFQKLIRMACGAAQNGSLVTLGVVPHRPETGYGYIQAGRKLQNHRGQEVYEALRFTEKPDRLLAEEYLLDGRYYWNSGMFVFQAQAILSAFRDHLPAWYDGLMEIKAAPQKRRAAVEAMVFERLEGISIDYGVMEKAGNILMLPCRCTWSDVGSFATMHEVLDRDFSNNVVQGEVLALESHGCVLRSEGRLLACVGLKNMVVVETSDVVMVCPLEEAQKVGRLVEELRRKKKNGVL